MNCPRRLTISKFYFHKIGTCNTVWCLLTWFQNLYTNIWYKHCRLLLSPYQGQCLTSCFVHSQEAPTSEKKKKKKKHKKSSSDSDWENSIIVTREQDCLQCAVIAKYARPDLLIQDLVISTYDQVSPVCVGRCCIRTVQYYQSISYISAGNSKESWVADSNFSFQLSQLPSMSCCILLYIELFIFLCHAKIHQMCSLWFVA